MNFVHPEYQTIYDTLKNNKSTIEHLTKIGALYTNSDYYNKFSYSIDTYAIETREGMKNGTGKTCYRHDGGQPSASHSPVYPAAAGGESIPAILQCGGFRGGGQFCGRGCPGCRGHLRRAEFSVFLSELRPGHRHRHSGLPVFWRQG